MPSSKAYAAVICRDCGAAWSKRADSIPAWRGRCRSCAQVVEKNKPESRERTSRNAKRQVLAQGGVPNAKKFTKGSTAGAKNHRWKGGITPINVKIRHSEEYKAWRKAVFARDDYTCQICGSRGGRLNADHIKPFSQFPHLRLALSNGRTLCVDCHRKTPTYGTGSRLSPSDGTNWQIMVGN